MCVYVFHIHGSHSPCDMPLSESKDNKLSEQPGNNDGILQGRQNKYWHL